MNLISRIFETPQSAIDWLLKPGTDRRHVALPMMASELRRAGYTVIRGRDHEGAAEHLRAHGWIVHRNFVVAQQAAVQEMRALGFRIFAPRDLPVFGTLWRATRGGSPDRLVLACDIAGHVAYRNMADGTDHVVAERTWDRWRTEMRAREG